MKVFLSWSGPRSLHIAKGFSEWLPQIINAVEPFISVEIEKGAQWSSELSAQLRGSHAGILCLTPENLTSPWLNFEAGALSKAVPDEDGAKLPRVWTYLFELQPANVAYPFAQFQHTLATREETLRLVRGINSAVARAGERALEHDQVTRAFNKWWPDLEAVLTTVPAATDQPKITVRPPDEMLAEILEIVRSMRREPGSQTPMPGLDASRYARAAGITFTNEEAARSFLAAIEVWEAVETAEIRHIPFDLAVVRIVFGGLVRRALALRRFADVAEEAGIKFDASLVQWIEV